MRCLLLSTTIGIFIVWLRIETVPRSLEFAFLAWFGFQAILVFGGVVWENMPVRLFAIHVGDALLRMIVISLIFVFV